MPRKSTKTTPRTTVRLTIPVSIELSTRLYGLARKQGITKHELCCRLIDRGIARFLEKDPELRRLIESDEAAA